MSTQLDEVREWARLVAINESASHESISGRLMVFNVCCKCGYRGQAVSQLGDYEAHVAEAIANAVTDAVLVPAKDKT